MQISSPAPTLPAFRWQACLVISVSLALALLFFLGHGQRDYSNGVLYASNAASLSRHFQPANILEWGMFESGLNAAPEKPLFNPGFMLLLSGVFQFTPDGYQLLAGSLLSIACLAIGMLFLFHLLSNLARPGSLVLAIALMLTNVHFISTMSRPLTDAPFWAVNMVLLWMIWRHPARNVWHGILLGVACTIRFQEIFMVPAYLVLILPWDSAKNNIRTLISISLGMLPWLAGAHVLNGYFTGQLLSLSGSNADVAAGMHQLQGTGFIRHYYQTFIMLLKELRDVFPVMPIFYMLLPSLFMRTDNTFIYKLRWFAVLGVLGVVAAFSVMHDTMPKRYLITFIPFLSFLFVDFILEQCHNFTDARKSLLRLLLVGITALPIWFGAIDLVRTGMLASLDNVHRFDWTETAEVLKNSNRKGIIASNYPGILQMISTEPTTLQLPNTFEAFNSGERNHEIGAIVYITNRFMTEHMNRKVLSPGQKPDSVYRPDYISWKPALEGNTIQDARGNTFLRTFQRKNSTFSVDIYTRQN